MSETLKTSTQNTMAYNIRGLHAMAQNGTSLQFMELNDMDLEAVVGGYTDNSRQFYIGANCFTKVDSGYLALRDTPAWGYSHETGALYNWSIVEILGHPQGDYVYVRVLSAVGQEGYDNRAMNGKEGWISWHFLDICES